MQKIAVQPDCKLKRKTRYLLIKNLVKKLPIEDNWCLYPLVTSTGQISIHFMENLKRLAFYKFIIKAINHYIIND